MDEVAQGTTGSTTLARLLWARADASPDGVALHHVVRTPGREATEEVTWTGTRALVEPLAAGLVGLGVEPGDRVVILSRTRVDWVLAHWAILCAGAVTVAVHPDDDPPEVAHRVDDSRAVVVVAEDRSQVEKLRVVRGDIRGVRRVVQLDGDYPDRRVMTFESLLTEGEELLAGDTSAIGRRIEALDPEALATVLYAGGATGSSVGVRRTHAAWVADGAHLPGAATRGLRRLDAPMTEARAHRLLARHLAHGLGTSVDGRADGSSEPRGPGGDDMPLGGVDAG